MSEMGNGQVTAEQETALQEQPAPAPVKQWLHPDALRPRDYIRGQTALKDVLAELGFENCYDFLGGPYAYPWMMWALRSRDDASFSWDQALDTEFDEFVMGGDRPPQTPPLTSSGSSETSPSASGSKPKRPRSASVPSSSPTSG